MSVDDVETFEAERPRLLRLATRMLADHAEAEDVVQQAWLRLDASDDVETPAAWLTTVTSRLCLDRLRARTAEPRPEIDPGGTAPDPMDDVVLGDDVGGALRIVLDRLSPSERVAFVLHDSFAVDFATVAAVLDTTPAAARKLASRARARVREATPHTTPAPWEVVDAFMAAARAGEFDRLLRLLAPDAVVIGDAAAVLAGTPERIAGQHEVATFFDGAATSALPVLVDDRPGSAWFLRGEAKVLFDFTIADAIVQQIDFRAEPDLLARVVRRRDGEPHPVTFSGPATSEK